MISEAANPFIADHVIGGNAVLPTVCATGWMAAACQQQTPGYRYFGYRNYRLYKGIAFDGSAPDSVNLEMTETNRSADQLTVAVSIWSQNAKGMRINHYAADINLVREIPATDCYHHFDNEDRQIQKAAELYSNGTLFHGPRFQGIDHVMNFSERKLTLACHAPLVAQSEQGQFAVAATNPYVDDLLFQAMLVWVRMQYGDGSLPASAKQVEQYRVVAPGERFYLSLDVISSDPKKCVADVIIHDEQGAIYTRLSGAEVTVSKQLNALFTKN